MNKKNTAARLLYITAGLTLDNSNFYPHTIFVSFMWFSGGEKYLSYGFVSVFTYWVRQ